MEGFCEFLTFKTLPQITEIKQSDIFEYSPENLVKNYRGDFSNGRYHGQGVIRLDQLTIYAGDFYNGNFHGKGLILKTPLPGIKKIKPYFDPGLDDSFNHEQM